MGPCLCGGCEACLGYDPAAYCDGCGQTECECEIENLRTVNAECAGEVEDE